MKPDQFISIDEVGSHVGKEVSLRGWVYRKREGKGIAFIVLRDSTGIVQGVIKDESKDFEKAQHAIVETSVTLSGTVNKDERAPGGYEVKISSTLR